MSKEIDFNKGSLTFWIPKGAIDYKGNEFIDLVNYKSPDGKIRIVKNKNNGIKVLYYYIDNGKCSLESNAENLDNDDKHMVAVTWSIPDMKVKLFIDGAEKKTCDIEII